MLFGLLTRFGIFGLVIGFLLHQGHDWLVFERPIHFWELDKQEMFSLFVNVFGTLLFLFIAIEQGNFWLWLGVILPDILEGLRLLFAKNGYDMWMKGDSQAFHFKSPINIKPLHISFKNFNKDIARRLVQMAFLLLILMFIN